MSEPVEKLSDKLRQLADQMDAASAGPPPHDMSVKAAVLELAKFFRSAAMQIKIEWSDFGAKGYEVSYSVIRSYREVESSGSLAALVQAACIKAQPQDTLDRLDMAAKADV